MIPAILVGRGLTYTGVVSVLEDLAALGMISHLLVVDSDAGLSKQSPARVMGIDPDTNRPFIRATTVQGGLAGQVGKKAHWAFFNAIDEPGRAGLTEIADVEQLRNELNMDRGKAYLNICATRYHSPDLQTPRPYSGCINLIVAPEDATDPATQSESYAPDDSATGYEVHVAVNIANLLGLWTGIAEPHTFDELHSEPTQFQLVRSFYHRISAATVQDDIRRLVFDTTVTPLPTLREDHDGYEVRRVAAQDKQAFIDGCAQDLFNRYYYYFNQPAENVNINVEQHTSSSEWAKFTGYYFKNVFTHPAAVFQGASNDARLALATITQETLLGDESLVQIQGARDNTVNNVVDRLRQLDQIEDRRSVYNTLSSFFKCYTNSVMMMVDAGPRVLIEAQFAQKIDPAADMESVYFKPKWLESMEDGKKLSIIGRPADVIPGPETHFGAELDAATKRRIGTERIAPYDVEQLGQALEILRHDDRLERYRRQLENLIDGQKPTYATAVANHLKNARYYNNEQLEIALEQRRQKIAETEEAKVNLPATVFRWLGWVTFWSMVILAGLMMFYVHKHANAPLTGIDLTDPVGFNILDVAGYVFEVMPKKAKAFYLIVWGVLWLLFYLLQILFESLDSYKRQHEAHRRAMELRDIEARIVAHTNSWQRCDCAVKQLVPVSDFLSAVINNPFGELSTEEMTCVEPGNKLPNSVLFATASPPQECVKLFAEQRRSQFFHEGWLGGQQAQAIRDAKIFTEESHRRALVDGKEFEDVFFELVKTDYLENPEFRGIVNTISSKGFRSQDRSRDEWSDLVSTINKLPAADLNPILQPLTVKHGRPKSTGSSSLEDLRSSGVFDANMFSSDQVVNNYHTVQHGFCTFGDVGQDALGSSTVLVQVSRPFEPEVLWRPTATSHAQPAVPSRPVLPEIDYDDL